MNMNTGGKKFLPVCILSFFGFCLWMVASHRLIFMDEISFHKNVLNFLVHKTLVPTFVDYPSFFSYLITPVIAIGFFLKFHLFPHFISADLSDPYYQTFFYEFHIYDWIYLTRAFVIIICVVCLYVFFRWVEHDADQRTAWLCTLLVISDPLRFYFSYATLGLPDMVIASMGFVVLAMISQGLRSRSRSWLYLSAFVAGLCTSMKLSGLCLALPVFFCLIIYRKHFSLSVDRLIIYHALCVVIGFFIGSPLLIWDPTIYTSGFSLETQLLFGRSTIFDSSRSPWWAFLTFFQLNPLFFILCTLVMIYSFLRRDRYQITLGTCLGIAFLIIATLSKRSMMYFAPLMPVPFFILANALARDRAIPKRKVTQTIVLGVFVFIFLLQFLNRVINHIRIPDNRQIAKEWIYENIPQKSKIFLEWGYYPEIFTENLGGLNWRFRVRSDQKLHAAVQAIHKIKPFYYVTQTKEHLADVPYGRYLITSGNCFNRYLENTPRFSKIILRNSIDAEIEFSFLKKFYSDLINEKFDFRLIQKFNRGHGPDVWIFKKSQSQTEEE